MTAKIIILLCTYNGESYLTEQLESIEEQTHQNWQVIASDDNSIDLTLSILKKYQIKWGEEKLIIRKGPQKGFCQNFLSLCSDSSIRADYYSFCDQDDVWLRNKLSRSLNFFETQKIKDMPTVYCGRTEYVDKNLKKLGFSPLFKRKPSFQNALIQSIAGGNTVMFNQGVKHLMEKIGTHDVVSHDWWLYQVVTGCGGWVFYDSTPQILYRQHEKALIGGNTSLAARLKRFKMAYNNQFKKWNEKNVSALKTISNELTEKNYELLIQFIEMRSANLIKRISLLIKSKLYRQTRKGTFSLVLATLLNKI